MILVFSGTGNTLAVAKRLGDELGETVREFTPRELTNPSSAVFEGSDDRIIWMFPTYSWGVPPLVLDIVRNSTLRFSSETTQWMVTTAGDDSGRIVRQFRKALENRDLSLQGAFSVRMPNTYTMMKGFDVDSEMTVKAKLEAMPGRVAEIARKIQSGKPVVDVFTGKWATIKTSVIYPWFCRYEITSKGFHTNDQCTKCGWCISHCPLMNISAGEDGLPQWGTVCTMCERCYHGCPSHAVEWRKATCGKGQYRLFINLFKPTNSHKK